LGNHALLVFRNLGARAIAGRPCPQ
jgi:hypothetical protein